VKRPCIAMGIVALAFVVVSSVLAVIFLASSALQIAVYARPAVRYLALLTVTTLVLTAICVSIS